MKTALWPGRALLSCYGSTVLKPPSACLGNSPHQSALLRFGSDSPRHLLVQADRWKIAKPTVIGWERGRECFVVINKAKDKYGIRGLKTTLKKGTYKDVREGWDMHGKEAGTIVQWDVPGRTAVMFVRVID